MTTAHRHPFSAPTTARERTDVLARGGLPCPTPTLARWNDCGGGHDLPEPAWPAGHVPYIADDGLPACSCGWPPDGVRTVVGGMAGGETTPLALTSWESGHLPDVLGNDGRAWVYEARRALLAAHAWAIGPEALAGPL